MGADGSLVGRDEELAVISDFLGGRGDGLVLVGASGMGKSSLWTEAIGRATELGTRVLQATPGEGEERYSHSVLLDLLRDVDFEDAPLSVPVRAALDGVLLRAATDGPINPQAVSMGTYQVLERLSAAREVVVCVDDVQWGDAGSLEALSFAARRLPPGRVRFLLARRSGYERGPLEALLTRRDLRYVEPRPLTVDETARLLVQHLTLVGTPRVVRLVHEQSRGNPLFALEVGRVLLERGVPKIGEPLGVPEEMAAVLGLRVRDLPEAQRTLLLAVSLDPLLGEDALASLVGADVVESAVRDRLVTITAGGRVRAWHPLLAAAARETATPARQRALHLELAGVVGIPGSRARHLALGADGADDALASLLAVESEAAASRGAVETGVELAELALTRTPAGSPVRDQRVLDLAARLADAGEGQRVTDFLMGEIEGLPRGRARGTAWLMMLNGIVGNMANVRRFIENALDDCGDADDVRAQALDMKALTQVGMLVAGVSAGRAWAEESFALGRTSGQGRDWCLVHAGQAPEGPRGIPHIKRLVWRGLPAEAEPELRAAISSAESEGRLREAMSLRVHLGDLLTRSGRVTEARTMLAMLEDADLADKESPDEEMMHAVVEAQSGDSKAARHWAAIADRLARDFGHRWIELEAARVAGIAALIDGDLEQAEDLFRGAWEWVASAGVRDPNIFPLAPELIETLVLLGRYDDAREVLSWLRERSEEQAHPWGTAMTARSHHLIGLVEGSVPVAEAEQGLREAAAELAALGLGCDAARADLALGRALRRKKQWGSAREALERAQASFEEMGADGWVEVTRSELAKVGGRQKRASPDELTPAELTTARLAAEGLSNKEIARRSAVSINTVEAHLTRAYAKLGVRSRSQLAAVLPD